MFDVLAHFKTKLERVFERIGLICFATAVIAEICAYPYSRRNDELSADALATSQREIATIDQANLRLRTDLEKETGKVATLQKDASDAKTAQQKVEIELGKQQERVAEANQKTETERLTRLKLEETLAPRIVTITGETNNELALFHGTKVYIEFVSDTDARSLAGQIRHMVELAQWNIVGMNMANPGGGGVAIFTNSHAYPDVFNNPLYDAATILSYQLKDNNIEAYASPKSPTSIAFPFPPGLPEDAVLIHVDKKPEPYFSFRINERLLDEQGRKAVEAARTAVEGSRRANLQYDEEERKRIVQKYKRSSN